MSGKAARRTATEEDLAEANELLGSMLDEASKPAEKKEEKKDENNKESKMKRRGKKEKKASPEVEAADEEEDASEKPQKKTVVRNVKPIGRRFEKGVVKKFILFSAAMIAIPLLATFVVYQTLVHAEDISNLSPKYLGWLQAFTETEFVSNNKIVVGGICGIICAIIIQMTYIFVSLNEDEDEEELASKDE